MSTTLICDICGHGHFAYDRCTVDGCTCPLKRKDGDGAAENGAKTQEGARMSVRAKFLCNSVAIDKRPWAPVDPETGQRDWAKREDQEQRTFNFTPVGDDPTGGENRKFWEASPSGSLQLGCVNEDVWPFFEVGETYYLDFTKAPPG